MYAGTSVTLLQLYYYFTLINFLANQILSKCHYGNGRLEILIINANFITCTLYSAVILTSSGFGGENVSSDPCATKCYECEAISFSRFWV